MDHILLADGTAYQGRYVTIATEQSKTVVSASESPIDAVMEAKRLGIDDPILIYVPKIEESSLVF